MIRYRLDGSCVINQWSNKASNHINHSVTTVMYGNNTGMAKEVWRGVRGLHMAAAAAADFSSVTKLLRHGPNKSAGEKWYTEDDRCLRKKQWLNQNTDNLCLSASPDTPVAIITLPLSLVLSLCLSLSRSYIFYVSFFPIISRADSSGLTVWMISAVRLA